MRIAAHKTAHRLFGMESVLLYILSFVLLPLAVSAVEMESKPDDPVFAKINPVKAPAPGPLVLKAGDRLAICGDSITAQKMYSRLIEDYLTACMPELKISVRQHGRSGEMANGFLGRMDTDCLPFKPTVATICYGMNDYRYKPYDEANARWYREKYTNVVKKFKEAGARVVLGSPGCVGKVASWVKTATGTLEQHNESLCALRNIDIEIARAEDTRFADVFWMMFPAGFAAKKRYGQDYEIAGKDGVHPGWAGQLVMAYAFLRAMGLDGNIGEFVVDLKSGKATASAGHSVAGFKDGALTLTSSKYPFCATGALNRDDSVRSGMTLVPFNRDLNRLTLKVEGGSAANYRVTWGTESTSYTAARLAQGVNLADDFPVNPFSENFAKIDKAVGEKQKQDQLEEAKHAPIRESIRALAAPVTHTIRIEALP